MMVREYRHVLAAMWTAGCWVRGVEEKREGEVTWREKEEGEEAKE